MYLTTQTNLYATQYLGAHPDLPPHSHYRRCQPVSTTEMKQFLSVYLLTGIIKKLVIHQYWSTHPMLKTQFFNDMMPISLFQSILDFFHFNDNSQYNVNDPNRNRLFKIRPVVEDLTRKFKSVYTLTQHVLSDVEILLWKGRLGFKQYIPNNHSQFGIKMFSLCEVSHYLSNSFVYWGKNSVETPEDAVLEKELGKSGAVALRLMARPNRLKTTTRNPPPSSFKGQRLEKADYSFRGDGNLLIVRCKDKKEIYFLSTIQTMKTEKLSKRGRDELAPSKLALVKDYNKFMGGADRNDALVDNYSCVRKSFKWTVKF